MFCFQRLLQYSNLFTYPGLKWNKRWIWRLYSLSASVSACFLSPFSESCATCIGWDDHFNPRHFQRLLKGKISAVDPVRPQNLQRRMVELRDDEKNPIKPLTVTSNESISNGESSGLHMTEQFKLVSNAQESKIFKSNVTTIKIKCSNTYPRRYSV